MMSKLQTYQVAFRTDHPYPAHINATSANKAAMQCVQEYLAEGSLRWVPGTSSARIVKGMGVP